MKKAIVLAATSATLVLGQCDPALQETFNLCRSNLLEGGQDPIAYCSNLQSIQVDWYKCLCDKFTAVHTTW